MSEGHSGANGEVRHGIALGSWPVGTPADGAFYRRLGPLVERSGYDLLFAGDHIFNPSPLMECLTLLAHLAATTERVGLGTSILIVPLRDPCLVAKQLATIDVLSDGRLVLGAGVGGEMEAEWRAVGVDTETRGRRMDEYLALLRQLWTGEPVEFDGEFRNVHGVTASPRPVQDLGPPVWIGGRSDAALRRATRHQGWVSYASSPRRVRESVEKLHAHAGGSLPDGFRVAMAMFTLLDDSVEIAARRAAKALQGRYEQDFTQIVRSIGAVGSGDDVIERYEAYREAGVQDFLWGPQVSAAEFPEQVERIAELLALGEV